MHRFTRMAALPLVAAGLVGVPAFAHGTGAAAATGSSRAKAAPAATATRTPTAAPGAKATPRATPTLAPVARPRPLTPKPVNVYIGGQLVAVGQSVGGGIARVRGQVPFAIKAPAYVPSGYAPVQLAVTPRQRDVSNGFSTLTYAPTASGKGIVTTTGFQLVQTARPLPFVRSTGAVTATVGGNRGTLSEFKAGKADLLILSWGDRSGVGYTLTTDAATSRLSRATLLRIANSLR